MITGRDSWENAMDKIQEVIVVEGKHDSQRLKQFFACETIETGGSSIGDVVIEKIQRAAQTKGVIIFTDPDTPGNQIRHIINQKVPGCKHAFVDKHNSRTDKKVGIEHADKEVLWQALQNLVTIKDVKQGSLTMHDLFDLGLTGGKDSAALRQKVGEHYHLGDGNAKTMLARLNSLNISYEELHEVTNQ